VAEGVGAGVFQTPRRCVGQLLGLATRQCDGARRLLARWLPRLPGMHVLVSVRIQQQVNVKKEKRRKARSTVTASDFT
jgi:hypothetical protein